MLHCVKITSTDHPAVKNRHTNLEVSRQTNSLLDAVISAVSQPIFLATKSGLAP